MISFDYIYFSVFIYRKEINAQKTKLIAYLFDFIYVSDYS